MKIKLFLVTYKLGTNETCIIHIQSSTCKGALERAYNYIDKSLGHPGISYDIIKIEQVGYIAI